MSNVERPEWIRPGAEVVVWSSNSSRADVVKIKSVGKVWITLDDDSPRIAIDTLESAHQGESWKGWRAHIAERNSPEAIKRLNRSYVRDCVRRAQHVQKEWDGDQLNQHKIAAVAKAMSNLNDAIVLMKENS